MAALEELIRAQNGFHARFLGRTGIAASAIAWSRSSCAMNRSSASTSATLRGRVKAFRALARRAGAAPRGRRRDFARDRRRRAADHRRAQGRRSRGSFRRWSARRRDMMSSGLAVAWILVLLSFAAVQIDAAQSRPADRRAFRRRRPHRGRRSHRARARRPAITRSPRSASRSTAWPTS